ncbi:TonB-dependent receptor [Psychrosphaera ytuae]|uniref:TonB-dependent receptor n=1 Tax=Psychrosphaera ytuae TaxID=2820710 RepID=A0A975DAK9_9GAMM|nr:TonB-dependent receptor [Psychrosphaera ytuae]QTH62756.1 TonB-dependent receptor [Psychrosphaera ytuae]
MNNTFIANAIMLGISSCASLSVLAETNSKTEQTHTTKQTSSIEVIKIQSKVPSSDFAAVHSPTHLVTANQTDVGQWLNVLTGAAGVNNGPITTLAQYRGYTGDRVGVTINNQTVVGAGPNSMDSPLSYAIAGAIDSVAVFRGISPVSVAASGLGGTIVIEQGLPKFSGTKKPLLSGKLAGQYSANNNANTLTTDINIANKQHALRAFSSFQQADGFEDGNGHRIDETGYQRNQSLLSYGYQSQQHTIYSQLRITNTNDSGTPALPMDIDYIDARQFSLWGESDLEVGQLNWLVSKDSAEHGMSNYLMRPVMPNMKRYNTAELDALNFQISLTKNISEDWLLISGIRHAKSEHDATITSPDNDRFRILNFNDVALIDTSVFVEGRYTVPETLSSAVSDGLITLGLQYTDHTAQSGSVKHHMAIMSPAIGTLQNSFNQTDTNIDEGLLDWVISYKQPMNDEFTGLFSIARKQRAASYQERFLWNPMQSTGGLADGNTYIGNLNLEAETAKQINLGLEYQTDTSMVSPQVFYHEIDDYISAVPSSNMAANMVASMMTGKTPLAFANVDAKTYGFDLLANHQLSDQWSLSGSVSVIRGQRRDMEDDLYRIAADRLQMTVFYLFDEWQLALQQTLVAGQNKVSELNGEQSSSGYSLTNLYALKQVDKIEFKVGIDNLFDNFYQDHLSGRYRPMLNPSNSTSIEQGEIIPGMGRNIYASITWYF